VHQLGSPKSIIVDGSKRIRLDEIVVDGERTINGTLKSTWIEVVKRDMDCQFNIVALTELNREKGFI